VREIVAADLRDGRITSVVTRFPPEPNGHLHIGHAKSICLNFGIAAEFGGRCHLRFDDTNPLKEEQEYIDAIQADVRWLGFDWADHLFYASDYFEQLYAWAVHLIRDGLAYVDDLSAEGIREHRGTLTQPGIPSPWRERSVEESLDLFARMRAGEFPDGTRVLRAKIDMASGNINLRDPVLYRILHATHPRTGDAWCVYPTYDFAHGQSDAIEGITHSICTLEFADHRPLYDWFIEHLPVPSTPHQYEFARLNLTWTVLSKRFLLKLVQDGRVRGWDDPRMPTIAGIRRRGYPAEGIRDFAAMIGVGKADSTVEIGQLEYCIRNVLNRTAPRRFGVLRPLKVVITDYPEGQVELMEAVNNPEDPAAGTRPVPFSRELWIEREDFLEDPPAKFFRLAPGREVRLRNAYFITCREVVKDATGEVVELRCTYDPATRGGDSPDGDGPRRRFTGCPRRTPSRRRSVSTVHCSRAPIRGRMGTCSRTSIPHRSRSSVTVGWRPRWRTRPWARPSSSSGWATSVPTPTRVPARPCSTGRSRSRTPGPGSRPRAGHRTERRLPPSENGPVITTGPFDVSAARREARPGGLLVERDDRAAARHDRAVGHVDRSVRTDGDAARSHEALGGDERRLAAAGGDAQQRPGRALGGQQAVVRELDDPEGAVGAEGEVHDVGQAARVDRRLLARGNAPDARAAGREREARQLADVGRAIGADRDGRRDRLHGHHGR